MHCPCMYAMLVNINPSIRTLLFCIPMDSLFIVKYDSLLYLSSYQSTSMNGTIIKPDHHFLVDIDGGDPTTCTDIYDDHLKVPSPVNVSDDSFEGIIHDAM